MLHVSTYIVLILRLGPVANYKVAMQSHELLRNTTRQQITSYHNYSSWKKDADLMVAINFVNGCRMHD